jgi:hypothetical protein
VSAPLRINLCVPTTAVRIGPLRFDGLQALLGLPLREVLAPLLAGEVYQRDTPTGVIDVYPLALPSGEGLTLPVRLLGEVGFRNEQGLLVLIVPVALAEVVRQQLADEISSRHAAGPRMARGADGAPVAEFGVRLRSGARKVIPIGGFGEIGVEAA